MNSVDPVTVTFMDCETLGLDPAAPIWEFAAIRRTYTDLWCIEQVYYCLIKHRPYPYLKDLPERFKVDYLKRYRFADPSTIVPRDEAARMIAEATNRAHIVGAVPNFDTERLQRLLHREGIHPRWHYHLTDIETLVVGFLAAHGEAPPMPWKSDVLSSLVGVDPGRFDRHTALGDVLWARAQYDKVMGINVSLSQGIREYLAGQRVSTDWMFEEESK